MKRIFSFVLLLFAGTSLFAQTAKNDRLFIDVHYLQPGNVSFADVATAHAKDLAVQGKYGVRFLKYWVDEKAGLVYCLSSAADSAQITAAHREAHGLLPAEVHLVTDGMAAAPKAGKTYFLDVHKLGAGKVTAADVAKAHEKDLAVQEKRGVGFINYWVDEKRGVVYCLSQAKAAADVVDTHKEAHGLLPDFIKEVKQGQ